MQNTLRLSALLATCGLAPSAPITVGGTTLTEFEVTFPSQMSLTFFVVGEPRFSPPVPHILNGSALDATSFGPASPQPTDGGVPVEKQPEDCLTINIMRPTGDDIIPLGAPVLQRGSSKVGAPTYGYLLADPRRRRAEVPDTVVLDHGVDVRYMFHNLTNAALETSVLLSEQVMDYWLSFVTI
ncbi:hypothetical protein GGF50DRAFT_117618 [Schizophyllum commune]